jgi:carboxyvinyl-carboxyphosphonate phosphorylmutase
MTDEFLTANGVRVAHQGHLPLAGAVKGMYDTLKALREGMAPRDLRGSVATSELMGQVTRKADYDHWTQNYMN